MSIRWRLWCALGLALLAASLTTSLTLAASTAGPAFGLRPVHYDPQRPATQSYFVYDAALGQTLTDAVLVRNSGTAAGTVRLYAVDATTGATSGVVYLTGDAPRQDVGAWIQLDQAELTLGPGEERQVPFTVTVPPAARAGQHLGALVAEDTAAPPGALGGAVHATIQTRAVTAVQVTLPGDVVEAMAVTGITPGGMAGTQQLLVGLRNDGTTLVKPTGTLTVTDGTGREVQRLPLTLDTFLPHTAIPYPMAVARQALGAGTYHATLDLTYGTSGATHYQGAFTVTPAQVAQVFPPQTSVAPLAPPSAAPTAPAGSPTAWLESGAGLAVALAVLAALLVTGFLVGRRSAATRQTP
jgi:hypothetical protein